VVLTAKVSVNSAQGVFQSKGRRSARERAGDFGKASTVGPVAPELAITVLTKMPPEIMRAAMEARDSLEVMSPWMGIMYLFFYGERDQRRER
jgi:hypothetical protein